MGSAYPRADMKYNTRVCFAGGFSDRSVPNLCQAESKQPIRRRYTIRVACIQPPTAIIIYACIRHQRPVVQQL